MKIGYLYLILTIMFSCIANAFAKMSKSFSNHKYGDYHLFYDSSDVFLQKHMMI